MFLFWSIPPDLKAAAFQKSTIHVSFLSLLLTPWLMASVIHEAARGDALTIPRGQFCLALLEHHCAMCIKLTNPST